METQNKVSWMSGKWQRVLVASFLIGAFIGTLIIVSGCAIVPRRRRRTKIVAVSDAAGSVDVVYVQKAPPKPKKEVRSKKPNKTAIWVPGHWKWNGRKYVWKSGHWEVKPGGKTWTPGHWEKRGRGWVWVKGRWR